MKVLIADEHALFRDGLGLLIVGDGGDQIPLRGLDQGDWIGQLAATARGILRIGCGIAGEYEKNTEKDTKGFLHKNGLPCMFYPQYNGKEWKKQDVFRQIAKEHIIIKWLSNAAMAQDRSGLHIRRK